MTLDTIKLVLLWCLVINYSILLLWVALVLFAHDLFFRLNARLFRISAQTFDSVNYAGIAIYKTAILLFNLVPYVALVLATGSR